MTKENKQMTIGLMGDVMIGRFVNETLNQVPAHYIWGDLLPLLKKNDLNLINLEAALTHSINKTPKTFHFKADPVKVRSLVEGSIHVVNVANNHILDYGEEGLFETLETLNQAKIHYIGAGRNSFEACTPVIITRKSIKVGILGCTDNEESWRATPQAAGTFYLKVGDVEAIQEPIQKLRKQVDLLIVSIHWGPNMRKHPTSGFKMFAHQLIDLGVDILHGHSAHIFQCVELYRDKLILYDAGDFIDDYAVDPILRNDQSFLFIATADKQGVLSLDLVPVVISNCQVNLARGKEAEEILLKMSQLSREMKTPFHKENNRLILTLR